MKHRFVILVGTMTGTSEMVADELSSKLEGLGHSVEVSRMEKVDLNVFQSPAVFIICTSTYGDGDVPDNAHKLYGDLIQRRPDLSSVRYCLFGLGDLQHHGATFARGGKRFDEILQHLNAHRVGEPCFHDSSSKTFPEETALKALDQWLIALDPGAG